MTIDISFEIDRKLEAVAARIGRAKDDCAREAIERFIEDAEDVALAESRLASPGQVISQEDLEREFGLGH